MVAKPHKPERKMPFGPKCKSPKATEKKTENRENGAAICEFDGEASPKDGLVADGGYITVEHEIHA